MEGDAEEGQAAVTTKRPSQSKEKSGREGGREPGDPGQTQGAAVVSGLMGTVQGSFHTNNMDKTLV